MTRPATPALGLVLLTACGAGTPSPTTPESARDRVREGLERERTEREWSRDPTAEAPLIDLARDPDEPAPIRVRAIAVLGEVFGRSPETRAALHALACASDPVAPHALEALEPGLAVDDRGPWRRERCDRGPGPETPSQWGPVAGMFVPLGFGFGIDDDDLGATAALALGIGIGLHAGVRYESVSFLLGGQALAAIFLSDQTRWYAGAGPVLLVGLDLFDEATIAFGGGFDYGTSGVSDDAGERTYDGFFPSVQVRVLATDTPYAIGALFHVVVPPDQPDLFGLFLGVLAAVHVPG